MQLIKIDDEQMIDARELHSFLGVGSKFHIWIKRRIEEYGYTQGVDFIVIKNDRSEIISLRLSLDVAKELCMVERNDRGREARQYFIEVEKSWREQNKNPLRALQQTVNELVRVDELSRDNARRLGKVEERLELLSSDSQYRTVRAMAKELGVSISEKAAADVGRMASKICRQRNLHMGYVADERHGRVRSYPVGVVKSVLINFSKESGA